MLEDRDYKFTDEQLKELGFVSYEELEKYYDIFYAFMSKGPWTKQECDNNLVANDIEYRLELPRRDRLKLSLNENVDVLLDWNSETWIPSAEDIKDQKETVLRILNVYCKFTERQAKIDYENYEKSSHHR